MKMEKAVVTWDNGVHREQHEQMIYHLLKVTYMHKEIY